MWRRNLSQLSANPGSLPISGKTKEGGVGDLQLGVGDPSRGVQLRVNVKPLLGAKVDASNAC